VDTVVTRCRGRENDEKHVTAEIYNARNTRQRDGDAKRTTGHSSLSLFFVTQSGHLPVGPAFSLGADSLRAVTRASDRGTASEARHVRDRRDRLGCSARGVLDPEGCLGCSARQSLQFFFAN
jgi:hypothetical protein